jgi:hypothetical protein
LFFWNNIYDIFVEVEFNSSISKTTVIDAIKQRINIIKDITIAKTDVIYPDNPQFWAQYQQDVIDLLEEQIKLFNFLLIIINKSIINRKNLKQITKTKEIPIQSDMIIKQFLDLTGKKKDK